MNGIYSDLLLHDMGPDLADSGSYRTYETLCLNIQEELRSLRPKANLEMEQGRPAKVY